MSVSSVEVQELDSNIYPGVVIQPAAASVVNVPMASSVLPSNASNVNFVLNSKVKIRPKPISILATSTSLPTSHTGLLVELFI